VLALALKDLSLVGRRGALMLGCSLFMIFYFTNTAFGLLLSILPSVYLVTWATGIDFRYKADSFLACLPARPRRIVGGRFLAAILAWAACFAGGLAIWALRSAFGPFVPASSLLGIAAFSLASCMAVNGFYLAAYYLFGYMRARWANLVFFVCVGAMGPIMNGLYPGAASTGLPSVNAILGGGAGAGFYAAVAAAGAAVYAAGYALALAAYSRRER